MKTYNVKATAKSTIVINGNYIVQGEYVPNIMSEYILKGYRPFITIESCVEISDDSPIVLKKVQSEKSVSKNAEYKINDLDKTSF